MRSAWWPCTQYATAAVYFWFSVSCLFSILFSLKHLLLINSFASRHSFFPLTIFILEFLLIDTIGPSTSDNCRENYLLALLLPCFFFQISIRSLLVEVRKRVVLRHFCCWNDEIWSVYIDTFTWLISRNVLWEKWLAIVPAVISLLCPYILQVWCYYRSHSHPVCVYL